MSSSIQSLLDRPREQRRREYKYRCAQAIVFGIPVVFLHYFGHRLGGPEALRWVALLQALLAGWVIYVAAAGMLFEGILRLRDGVSSDLLIACVALGMYLFSLISVLALPLVGRLAYRPLLFHLVVILLAGWSGIQWFRLRVSLPPTPPRSRHDK